ncbi:hypothetical protein DL93DRAFT_1809370 [Clavulina sp. PMI_390]|nr:hypothetical protein DL93DRAFT_1809370 [Clavulina sp. PMI_390]
MAPILEQPVESLDAIALEIDRAHDLLSLALTCQALYTLVYFRHLRFRVISGRLEDWRLTDVWDMIARDKTLGRSVRVLDIHPLAFSDARFIIPLDENKNKKRPDKGPKKQRAPKLNPYDALAEIIVDHFIPALRNMSRLRSFSLEESSALMFSTGDEYWGTLQIDSKALLPQMWEAVQSCSSLNRLLVDISRQPDHSFFETVRNENLTEFTWRSDGLADYLAFEGFLSRGLPRLQKLAIAIMNPLNSMSSWTSVLHRCHWPHLQLFEIGGQTAETFDPIAQFLIRHPLIEQLTYNLTTALNEPNDLKFLPKLRALHVHVFYLVDVLSGVTSTVLETVEVRDRRWDRSEKSTTLARITKALKDHQSVAYLGVKPPIPIGDYRALVEVLPGLKSVNGVQYEQDYDAFEKEICLRFGEMPEAELDDFFE